MACKTAQVQTSCCAKAADNQVSTLLHCRLWLFWPLFHQAQMNKPHMYTHTRTCSTLVHHTLSYHICPYLEGSLRKWVTRSAAACLPVASVMSCGDTRLFLVLPSKSTYMHNMQQNTERSGPQLDISKAPECCAHVCKLANCQIVVGQHLLTQEQMANL